MIVPAPLRPAAHRVATIARRARAHGRGLRAYLAGPSPRGAARVWYALDEVPSREHYATGGLIKLQPLTAAFPNEPTAFNILYLVSSRLPDGVQALAAWARRKGARIVLNQNGVAYQAWYGSGWERVNDPIRAALAAADHVFYQSEFCRLSADKFAGRAHGTAEVLYNPVDTSHFTPSRAPAASERLTLLLAGSQDQWYRVESALRAVAVIARQGLDVRLIVTGRLRWVIDGAAARRDATDLIAALGIGERVEFTGPYTQAEAPAIYQQADVLLHTKYNDPCPTVVLEAMACGVPIVYSGSGGVPELVGADAGIGIPADLDWQHDHPVDPAALADAVLRVLDRRAVMAEAARQRAVQQFDVRRWIARHQQLFQQLAA